MIKKYTKKPVIIEAIQYHEDDNGGNINEISNFANSSLANDDDGNVYIITLEGNMKISDGDFIIKGVKGEFYPCKPDIFKETYEEKIDPKTLANKNYKE